MHITVVAFVFIVWPCTQRHWERCFNCCLIKQRQIEFKNCTHTVCIRMNDWSITCIDSGECGTNVCLVHGDFVSFEVLLVVSLFCFCAPCKVLSFYQVQAEPWLWVCVGDLDLTVQWPAEILTLHFVDTLSVLSGFIVLGPAAPAGGGRVRKGRTVVLVKKIH